MRSALFIAICACVLSQCVLAQKRTVAFTVDDLPFVRSEVNRGSLTEADKQAASANRTLLAAFARHHLPVTGFVNEKGIEDLGSPAGAAILRDWTTHGFDLGNHTHAHLDFNSLTVAEFETEIARGEKTFLPLMKAAGRKPEFFRFPFNHTGDTQQKHDAIAAYLASHGYRLAPCTIETSDWLFNQAYGRIRSRHDEASATRLRSAYLQFTAVQIDYFATLDLQVLGYDAPQIMLIHDNQLNADVIDDLPALFEKRQYRFVSLDTAENNPAYRIPETFITAYGPMWGYRWARELHVKVNGSLEQEPPAWVVDSTK